jgi:hypothetical protein
MAYRKPAPIPPDLLEAIVEETRQRLQRDAYAAAYHEDIAARPFANEAALIGPSVQQAPRGWPDRAAAGASVGRNTLMSRFLFLWIMAGVLTLSVGFSVIVGLCVAGLIMAFMIVPISAPFFLVGAAVAIGLFYLQRMIARLNRRAADKSDWIRIQKQLRHA